MNWIDIDKVGTLLFHEHHIWAVNAGLKVHLTYIIFLVSIVLIYFLFPKVYYHQLQCPIQLYFLSYMLNLHIR